MKWASSARSAVKNLARHIRNAGDKGDLDALTEGSLKVALAKPWLEKVREHATEEAATKESRENGF